MHLFIITRGIKHNVDQMITQLQGKYLPQRFQDPKDGKIKEGFVQVGVRPIQLWEIVFPEESADLMINTLCNGNSVVNDNHKKAAFALRKMLGAKKIPEVKNKDLIMPLFKDWVEVNGIGIKYDYYVDARGNKHWDLSAEEKKKCWEGL